MSSLGDKIVKLRDRQLLSRFLEFRPGIVPKLDYTICNFEMSLVVRTVCANDGTLFIPSDKETLMNLNKPDPEELPTIRPIGRIGNVMIIDMMAVP